MREFFEFPDNSLILLILQTAVNPELLYPLQNCYAFEEKSVCHHNFMKKSNSKLSKYEPENIP